MTAILDRLLHHWRVIQRLDSRDEVHGNRFEAGCESFGIRYVSLPVVCGKIFTIPMEHKTQSLLSGDDLFATASLPATASLLLRYAEK